MNARMNVHMGLLTQMMRRFLRINAQTCLSSRFIMMPNRCGAGKKFEWSERAVNG